MISKELEETIINEYLNGMPLKDISKKTNISIYKIQYFLKKKNFTTRKLGNSKRYRTRKKYLNKIFNSVEILSIDEQNISTCKCGHCGNIFNSQLFNVVCGHTKSCGCLKRGKNSPFFEGYEGIYLSYVNAIKIRAKRKNIDFDLDAKFLWDLFIAQNKKCAISGEELYFNTARSKNDGNASLDRIDSCKGYTKNNVQWVTKQANTLKWNLEQKKLLLLIKKIYEYQKLSDNIIY